MAPLTILSGADARYARSLAQLILSVRRRPEARAYRLWLYDLGLTPAQRARLERLCAGRLRVEWRAFDFEKHPPHFRPGAGTYAWKPVLIADALAAETGPLLWLDSATLIWESLEPVGAWLEAAGVYVPYSGTSTLQALTHPATLAALQVEPELLPRRQRGSGVVGLHGGAPLARALAQDWRTAALRPEWLAPAGASLRNHRFEQSLLTILLYRYERNHGLRLTEDEQDISSAHPLPFLSVRNKVRNGVPLALDFLIWRGFRLWRRVDAWWIGAGLAEHWRRLVRAGGGSP